MITLMLLLLVVASLVFFWTLNAVERAQYTKTVGYIKETLVLGFFINTANLSDRLNSLDREEAKLKARLTKVTKLKEDEAVHLRNRVEAINEGYRTHLHRWNGKRYWKYWFRKVPVPSIEFVKELEAEAKPKPKQTETWYSLDDIPSHFKPKRGSGIATVVFTPRKDQGNNNQRKKGGNQQNNGNKDPQVIVVDHKS